MFNNIEVNSHKIKASLSHKQQQNALIVVFTAILTSLLFNLMLSIKLIL